MGEEQTNRRDHGVDGVYHALHSLETTHGRLSEWSNGGRLVASGCRHERINDPLTQREYREAACTQKHVMFPIRNPVCPQNVVSCASHSHVISDTVHTLIHLQPWKLFNSHRTPRDKWKVPKQPIGNGGMVQGCVFNFPQLLFVGLAQWQSEHGGDLLPL